MSEPRSGSDEIRDFASACHKLGDELLKFYEPILALPLRLVNWTLHLVVRGLRRINERRT